MNKKYIRIILILSLIAIPITLYLLYLHFFPGESFCNVNQLWDCNVVNQTKYAELLGVPTALWGFFAYTFLSLWMIFELLDIKIVRVCSTVIRAQMLMSIVGLFFLFALYLSYIEFFVLHTICMLCLSQQILILGIAIVAILNLKKVSK